MFRTVGTFLYTKRKWILWIWGMILLLSIVFSLRLPGILKGSGFVDEHAESTLGRNLLRDTLHTPVAEILILLKDPVHPLEEQSDQDRIQRVKQDISHISHVTSVIGPTAAQISKDHHTGYIEVGVDVNEDEASSILPELRQITSNGSNDTLIMTLAGDAVFYQQVNEASQTDLKKAETIGLPITLLVLVFAFGSIVAAGLPLLVGVTSAVVTLAILYGIGHLTPLSVFVLNIPTMLGIAVGVDYSLLLVSRFREELSRSSIQTSIEAMMATAGRSVFFSGITVMIGISSMFFFDMMVFRSVMIGGILVVWLTLCTSLTLLPAVLAVIGERINRFRILPRRTHADNDAGNQGWLQFATTVMRFPWVSLVSALLILFFCAMPIRHAVFAIPGLEALPESYQARQAMETLYDTFGKSKFNPAVVVVQKESGSILDNQSTIDSFRSYVDWLKQQKQVDTVTSFLSVAGPLPPQGADALFLHPPTNQMEDQIHKWVSGSIAQLVIPLHVDADSPEATQFVKTVRAHTWNGYHVYVSGITAGQYDFNQSILRHVPAALLYAFVVTYVLLLLAFQSVLLPLKAILMNCLSLLASFGVLVWIFVEGHLSQLLSLQSGTNINSTLPVFVFAFVFGTSMDYEVFMLTRIQEEYRAGLSNQKATIKGLAITSKLITSAALILVLLTGSFVLTDVLPVKQIGLGLAIAVALDATIVRLFLVPSLMKLLGDWNWWVPRWMKNWIAKTKLNI